jgi:hypothetical protein
MNVATSLLDTPKISAALYRGRLSLAHPKISEQ